MSGLEILLAIELAAKQPDIIRRAEELMKANK
jgi:hypothetical protein